ncbi:hypothetical protein B0H14DRAFT_2740342, partial [Mycena olivaceomarginata]
RAWAQMVHPAIYATALAAARSMRRTGGKVVLLRWYGCIAPASAHTQRKFRWLNNAPKASPLSPIAIVHRPISNRGAGLGVLLTQGTRQQSCNKRWRDPNQNNDCGLTADTPSMHSEKTNASRKS